MHYLGFLLMLQQTPAFMPHMPDPRRVEKGLAADSEVLRSLRENGGEPNVLRPVDVRFVGTAARVAKLKKQISSLGWRVVQRVPVDADSEALDVQRDQTTDSAAIRRLTEAAREIEARFGVRYDGWGTVATKR
ncbi:ribonuclease E inhibitor RraB [Sphingomonas sp. BK345]|uniref:ribonuclease E inhibitor RraB n=1 Tax=Sphingomonas sp. BK345 TaxID=2586980 RepID=UPI0016114FB3|nr:ribonuclease E inhibitor RraB [Sphingomonas sp. BK345]MBB3475418.1 hypothetical protein [Sphingomonas sp. BK345]